MKIKKKLLLGNIGTSKTNQQYEIKEAVRGQWMES